LPIYGCFIPLFLGFKDVISAGGSAPKTISALAGYIKESFNNQIKNSGKKNRN
jgi:hypothetical protein